MFEHLDIFKSVQNIPVKTRGKHKIGQNIPKTKAKYSKYGDIFQSLFKSNLISSENEGARENC